MDLETLTLVKLLVVAGLAWLSLRKIKRMQAQQQQIKSRHEACMLQEMPIIEKIKIKQESCLSTSATSKQQVTYQEYNNVIDKFWEKNDNQGQQDNRMDIEQPQQINQFSEFKKRNSQNSATHTQIKINYFNDTMKPYSQNTLQCQAKDISKRVENKRNWRDRLKSYIVSETPKSILNQYKKTIVKKNKSHLFSKKR